MRIWCGHRSWQISNIYIYIYTLWNFDCYSDFHIKEERLFESVYLFYLWVWQFQNFECDLNEIQFYNLYGVYEHIQGWTSKMPLFCLMHRLAIVDHYSRKKIITKKKKKILILVLSHQACYRASLPFQKIFKFLLLKPQITITFQFR